MQSENLSQASANTDSCEQFHSYNYCPQSHSKADPKELGRQGEEAACRYLKLKDYELLERNWKCIFGEADIIALDEDEIVFVEVKTRVSGRAGLPEDSITASKRRRYEKIATEYLRQLDSLGDRGVRFDVIAMNVLSDDRAFLRHHVNAFGYGE